MIASPETIDAAWLTQQLQTAGYRGTEVERFSAQQVGTGQIGKCVRYQLEYAHADPGAPASLIGKFPSDDPASRATGVGLRNYYREVCFYQELADELSISTPICYHAAIEGDGPEFALLLEDMHPAQQGDQLKGCSTAVARQAVLEIVGMQAPSWCDASLERYDWLADLRDNPDVNVGSLYQQTLPGFLDRYGTGLESEQRRIISAVAEAENCVLFQPRGTPFCLEHVDYRLDNMLIDERDPNAPKVTVVDWQSVKLGRPLNDVAYFLGAGLLPEVRKAEEASIVRDYHAALEAAGIHDFDWDTCWLEYRRSSVAAFAVFVVASMLVGQTERGDEMFLTMADRHSRHALDLDVEALF